MADEVRRVEADGWHDAVAAAVASGSRVDVWATDARAAEVEAPTAILEGVDVLSVDRGGGDFASSGAARIEVYVPDGRIAEVVRAQALGHHISVVEVPRAGPQPEETAQQAEGDS